SSGPGGLAYVCQPLSMVSVMVTVCLPPASGLSAVAVTLTLAADPFWAQPAGAAARIRARAAQPAVMRPAVVRIMKSSFAKESPEGTVSITPEPPPPDKLKNRQANAGPVRLSYGSGRILEPGEPPSSRHFFPILPLAQSPGLLFPVSG